MRVFPAAAFTALLAVAGPAMAQSQPSVLTPSDNSQDNNVIAVPPAPPIVAAPPTPLTPASPDIPATPGLLPPNPPTDASNPDAGNPDSGNADTGNTQSGGNAAGAPSLTGQSPGAAAPGQDQSQDQDTIPTAPNVWQPGKFAKIGVLDKVDGEVKEISVPVGGQSVVGDLQVSVLACVLRPPDQVPDAAVFLSLQNTGDPAGAPDYRGWLVRSAPGAAIAGDASETLRIIGCS
jgi:hypothetical protein